MLNILKKFNSNYVEYINWDVGCFSNVLNAGHLFTCQTSCYNVKTHLPAGSKSCQAMAT